MDLKLKDKVVLINGATGGIGRAVCFALKAEGAKIALSGRDADKVKQKNWISVLTDCGQTLPT